MATEARPKIGGAAMPELEDQELRVFYSVDVAGSTEYKTKHFNIEEYHQHWARFYEVFFTEFPTTFIGEADKVAEKLGYKSNGLSTWKLSGDEILFTAHIEAIEHVHLLTKAFYRTLSLYDENFRSEKYFLRLKGAGWTAGFPIRNSRIKPGVTEGSDYIGPDIDLGFRLCRAARPGRMVVSMDLADLLAQTDDLDGFQFNHVGWEVLKGVFNNQPYPIIWVSTTKRVYTLPWEDFTCAFTKSFMEKPSIDPQKLRSMIQEIRGVMPDLKLFAPYIDQNDMPDHHKRIWEKWESERGKQEDETFPQDEGLDMAESSLQGVSIFAPPVPATEVPFTGPTSANSSHE